MRQTKPRNLTNSRLKKRAQPANLKPFYIGVIIAFLCTVVVFYITSSHNTPLHKASQKGDVTEVKTILAKAEGNGNIINAKNTNGMTPLHIACDKGHTEVIKALLEEEDIDVNVLDKKGYAPLMYACEQGSLKNVKTLCSHEDIDVNCEKSTEKPLINAVINNRQRIVEVLLQHGAKINESHVDKLSLLVAPITNGNKKLFALLLAYGADIHETDDLSQKVWQVPWRHSSLVGWILS